MIKNFEKSWLVPIGMCMLCMMPGIWLILYSPYFAVVVFWGGMVYKGWVDKYELELQSSKKNHY